MEGRLVPDPDWGALLQAEALPLLGVGTALGALLTKQLLSFLDLQNPEILVGTCPSCESPIKQFSGGAAPDDEALYKCNACGCKMVLSTRERRIKAAGLGDRRRAGGGVRLVEVLVVPEGASERHGLLRCATGWHARLFHSRMGMRWMLARVDGGYAPRLQRQACK
ncbi:unnamed protein product [Prorocentrum cordatum]|uniref:Uncharacterized protein n=1 Tax=Prorocentrum cordatum TaxID=2364126 RepID=A0ABN9VBK2_9DINO|nr:unnamed protein product [Polarella glacialis]